MQERISSGNETVNKTKENNKMIDEKRVEFHLLFDLTSTSFGQSFHLFFLFVFLNDECCLSAIHPFLRTDERQWSNGQDNVAIQEKVEVDEQEQSKENKVDN